MRLALRVLVQADQVVQVAQLEIVQVGIAAVLADRVQADQVVPVVLVDLVLQVLAAVSLVRAHQVEHQVELRVAHQVAGQVVDRIQPAVVETRRVRLVNLAVGHQRVASQSEQSVKSLTT